MSQIVDINTATYYQWGNASDGWHLLNRDDLSVIRERVPPGDVEVRHFHTRARQFFYVLTGKAVIEVGGTDFQLSAGQGLEVPPGTPHRFRNESSEPVTFLVVSSPHSHGDRTELS